MIIPVALLHPSAGLREGRSPRQLVAAASSGFLPVGNWPEGMRVQYREELNLGRGTAEGSSSGRAGLSHSCLLTTLAFPAAPQAQPVYLVLKQHPARPGRPRARHTQGCLAWEGMGVSKQDESTAIQVFHIFMGTRSRAQAARPREAH